MMAPGVKANLVFDILIAGGNGYLVDAILTGDTYNSAIDASALGPNSIVKDILNHGELYGRLIPIQG